MRVKTKDGQHFVRVARYAPGIWNAATAAYVCCFLWECIQDGRVVGCVFGGFRACVVMDVV